MGPLDSLADPGFAGNRECRFVAFVAQGKLKKVDVSGGSAAEELLLKSGPPTLPIDWSPDGRFLL